MLKYSIAACAAFVLFAGFAAFSPAPAHASAELTQQKSFVSGSVVEREGSSGGHRQRRGGGRDSRLSDTHGVGTVSEFDRRGRGRDDAPGDDHGRRRGR